MHLPMQRIVDIAGALLALILLFPVLLSIMLLIAVVDGLPVMYRQTRVGKNERPFLILKFRSMRVGASGCSLTAAGDSRVTPLGRWLRKFKLDELPQFINVLLGDMSLVGPRPEVPDYVQFEDPLWQAVLSTRPGITDLASLAFRDEEQLLAPMLDRDHHYRAVILPAKLRLNLLYLRSRSFVKDVRLLWLTAFYSFLPFAFNRDRVLRTMRSRV